MLFVHRVCKLVRLPIGLRREEMQRCMCLAIQMLAAMQCFLQRCLLVAGTHHRTGAVEHRCREVA